MFLEQGDIDVIANRLRISNNMCQSRLTWGYLYAIQVCNYIIQPDNRLRKPTARAGYTLVLHSIIILASNYNIDYNIMSLLMN